MRNPTKKYFSGWNLVINGLIAIIPATLMITILKELEFSGAIVTMGILFGFMYLSGYIREKFSNKEDNEQKIMESDKVKTQSQIDNNKRQKPNKKWFWIGIGIIIIIYLISRTNETFSPVKMDKTSEHSEVSNNLYRNTKYNFRIKFPEGWQIRTGDGSNILQKAVKGNATISVGVREIPKILSSNTDNIDDLFTLEEFREDAVNQLKQKFSNVRLIDDGVTRLGSLPTYWIKYSASSSTLDINVEITNLQYQLLHKNIFYFISAGTTPSEFPLLELEFKKTIGTFVIESY